MDHIDTNNAAEKTLDNAINVGGAKKIIGNKTHIAANGMDKNADDKANITNGNSKVGEPINRAARNWGKVRNVMKVTVHKPAVRLRRSHSFDKKRQTSPPSKPIDDNRIKRTLRGNSNLLDTTNAVPVKNESKVLVLYTGGTIGMVRNAEGALACQPHAMEKAIRKVSTMHDETYSKIRFGKTNEDHEEDLPLVLPHVPKHKRVVYVMKEYDPLLDSSNMTMDDWIQIAKDIKSCYEMFDAFVILHGTDTMGYTSSALSFMLENLGKTVILTGSQIPCFETRSDGRDNLVGALIMAGNYIVPEVTVYFNRSLLRGNRTIKVSSGNLDAFKSPNLPPLATVGIDISVDTNAVWKKTTNLAKFKVQETLCRDVVLLRLFPSIHTNTVKHFLAPPIKGVVLQCYGAGNMPSNRQDIVDALAEASKLRRVIIMSCTQCSEGAVSGIYETGKTLIDAGVIPGSDITPEAALTKLSYVLSKDEWSHEEKRRKMSESICGEMSVQFDAVNPSTLEVDKIESQQSTLIEEVAKSMKLSSGREMSNMRKTLFPSLICSAIYLGDLDKLKALVAYDADFSAGDYDQRTPLHVAASEGKVDIVRWLLEQGASVHARDRNNDTPLMSAVNGLEMEVISMLVSCGAHLSVSHTPTQLGDKLVMAIGQGAVETVRCLLAAGLDPNVTTTMSGNSGLHAAVECDQQEVVRILLMAGADPSKKNKYGMTVGDLAHKYNRTTLLNIYNLERSGVHEAHRDDDGVASSPEQ